MMKPFDESLVQIADGFALRLDPRGAGLAQFVDEAIVTLSHGPFKHVGIFGGDGTYMEQNPPDPMQKTLAGSDRPALFERGLLCHVRLKHISTEQQLRALGWFQTHLGAQVPYGYLSIVELGVRGVLESIPALAGIVEELPNFEDYQDAPVCSCWDWLGWCYGVGYDWAAPAGIGTGSITPAQFSDLIKMGILEVIQDNGTI